MKILSVLTILSWILFGFLIYIGHNVDTWMLNARRDLTAVRARIPLKPHESFRTTFDVEYSVLYILAFQLDKTYDFHNSTDSLVILWQVTSRGSSINGYTERFSASAIDRERSFGSFEASYWKDYELAFTLLSVPTLMQSDSANFHCSVGRAQVSVGNELSYGLLEKASTSGVTPALWLSIGMTTIWTMLIAIRLLRRNNGV